MIMDSLGTFADALAYGGSPTVVNLGSEKAGPGNPLNIIVKGTGLVAATGFTIKTGATAGAATTLVDTYAFTSAQLNAGVRVTLTTTVNKFVALALTGSVSAGTWTATIQNDDGQTNK